VAKASPGCEGEKREWGARIVYAVVLKMEAVMEAVKVGIREFRDNLATYLLESETPVAITRHGDTVGHYFPVKRKRTDEDRAAFKEASDRVSAMMVAVGVTEEEIIEDFERMKREERKRRSQAE
jgi:hypothetical protein